MKKRIILMTLLFIAGSLQAVKFDTQETKAQLEKVAQAYQKQKYLQELHGRLAKLKKKGFLKFFSPQEKKQLKNAEKTGNIEALVGLLIKAKMLLFMQSLIEEKSPKGQRLGRRY